MATLSVMIGLDDDAVQIDTRGTLVSVFREVTDAVARAQIKAEIDNDPIESRGTIRDPNGNSIGTWRVE